MTATGRAPGVRWLLLLDAALETALAAMCAILAYGLLGTGHWSVPSWLTRPLLLAVAAILVLAAVVLWHVAGRPDPAVVRAIAIANGVTALAALGWAIAGLGAGIQVRILLSVTAVLLGAIATAQYVRSRP